MRWKTGEIRSTSHMGPTKLQWPQKICYLQTSCLMKCKKNHWPKCNSMDTLDLKEWRQQLFCQKPMETPPFYQVLLRISPRFLFVQSDVFTFCMVNHYFSPPFSGMFFFSNHHFQANPSRLRKKKRPSPWLTSTACCIGQAAETGELQAVLKEVRSQADTAGTKLGKINQMKHHWFACHRM